MSIKKSIRNAYKYGMPLTDAQYHFLWFNQHKLGYEFENMAQYYRLNPTFKSGKTSFIQPHEKLSPPDIQRLYKRLQLMLTGTRSSIELPLTLEQFLVLKNGIGELIFYHGNQLLTGAPFFAGGIPRVDFFQWGNLLGVVKYEELLSEKGVDGNILIYFEDMSDRELLQAIKDYQLQQHNLELQKVMSMQAKTLEPIYVSPTPKLILQPT
ncbi:MAG: hypothetical protein LEGION0398_MBIBDBAK_00884 [Legionellaceae bacterium]